VNCRHYKNFVFASKPNFYKNNHHTGFHRTHVVRIVMEPGPFIAINGPFYYRCINIRADKRKMGFFQKVSFFMPDEFFMYDPLIIRTLEPGYSTMVNGDPGQITFIGHTILLQRFMHN
jgi:hypothetical protein